MEFLRRFLQHVLPHGFVKIRPFGWLANRSRKNNLALCRGLLSVAAIPTSFGNEPRPRPTCPVCHIGSLSIVGRLSTVGFFQAVALQPIPLDSSYAYLSLFSAMRPLLGIPRRRSDQCVHVAHSSTTFQQVSGACLFRAISSTWKTRQYGTATRPFRATSAFNPLYIGSGLVQTLLSGMLGRSMFQHAPAFLARALPIETCGFSGRIRNTRRPGAGEQAGCGRRFPEVRLDTPYSSKLGSSTWMIRSTYPGGAPAFHPNLCKGVRLMNARRSSLDGQLCAYPTISDLIRGGRRYPQVA